MQDYLAFVNGDKDKYSVYNEKTLKEIEMENMRHIYVRIYIDTEDKIAYIIGIISRGVFMKTMILKKMIQHNRSEKALYLATSLRNGENIDILSKLF